MSQADGRTDRRLTQHNNALYVIDRAVKKLPKEWCRFLSRCVTFLTKFVCSRSRTAINMDVNSDSLALCDVDTDHSRNAKLNSLDNNW